MHWLQDPNQSSVGDLNNVRREASRYFRNKKKKYLKAKIDELETGSKIRNIRDLYMVISDLRRRVASLELMQQRMRRVIGLQTPTVFWLGGGTSSVNSLSIHGVRRQKYIQLSHQGLSRVPLSLRWLLKSQKDKSPGISEIPPELVKVGGWTIRSEIH